MEDDPCCQTKIVSHEMYFSAMYRFVDIAGRSSTTGSTITILMNKNGDFQPLYAKIYHKR